MKTKKTQQTTGCSLATCFPRKELYTSGKATEDRQTCLKSVIAKMNIGLCLNDIKYGLIVLLIAICYTAMRFEIAGAPWDYIKVYNFSVALPFGKRILTAWLGHIGTWFGLPIGRSFELVELSAVVALLVGTGRIFCLYLEVHVGRLAGLLLVGIMPGMFMLHLYFNGLLAIWDTTAMALTAWGIYGLLTARWGVICLIMTLASFNRETALLLPLLFIGMYLDRYPWWKVVGITVGLMGIYTICQWMIGLTLSDNEVYFEQLVAGTSIRETWDGVAQWRILHNLAWLNEAKGRWLTILGTVGCLPVWFLGVIRHLPGYFRRFGLVAWGYAWMLALVGNVYEPRIFGEISVILFIPVVLGIFDSIKGGDILSQHELDGKPNALARIMPWLEGGCFLAVSLIVISLAYLFAHGWPY